MASVRKSYRDLPSITLDNVMYMPIRLHRFLSSEIFELNKRIKMLEYDIEELYDETDELEYRNRGNADKMREDMARLNMHVENYWDKIKKLKKKKLNP